MSPIQRCRFSVRGFTIIELLVTLIVLVIVITVGMPTFMSLVHKYRLRGTADLLFAELILARTTAIKRNEDIFVDTVTGLDWCVGFDNDYYCNCSVADDCTVGGKEWVVAANEHKGAALVSTTLNLGRTRLFPRAKGVSNSGEIRLKGDNGAVVALIISPLGHVRICSDEPSMGYPSC